MVVAVGTSPTAESDSETSGLGTGGIIVVVLIGAAVIGMSTYFIYEKVRNKMRFDAIMREKREDMIRNAHIETVEEINERQRQMLKTAPPQPSIYELQAQSRADMARGLYRTTEMTPAYTPQPAGPPPPTYPAYTFPTPPRPRETYYSDQGAEPAPITAPPELTAAQKRERILYLQRHPFPDMPLF